MTVTIDIEEPRVRVHLTATTATLVAHAHGVPYAVEEYPIAAFIDRLRAARAAGGADA